MSEDSRQAISPLRQRMIEDMRMRKLERRTQEMYIRGACRLAKYLGRSPQTATAEDLRRFQLHLVEAGIRQSLPGAVCRGPTVGRQQRS